jgi:ribosomal protein S18 acetylase RimI-like enzyme
MDFFGDKFTLRSTPVKEDIERVREIVTSTGFFREDEIEIAVELIDERIKKGKESGYEFLFVDYMGVAIAYSCFGIIPCSLVSYDLYWIVTHNDFRNQGIGKQLMKSTERAIKDLGGRTIYVETSSKEQYTPTRKFYDSTNYLLKAQFEDFYDIGDDKLVYIKKV